MLTPVALTWMACADFATVDEACKDSVKGDKDASAAAIAWAQRIGCYRRYVGLDRGKLHPKVTEAVEAHAFYLEQNGIPADWWLEASGSTGYTGATSYDRLERTEYLAPDSTVQTFVWEVLGYADTDDAGATVDDDMHNPFFRDVYLAPGWMGAGYSEGTDPAAGTFFYSNVVLRFPSGSRTSKPVVYPQDGQIDVPVSWVNPFAGDPTLPGVPAVTGYPVTFTAGSSIESFSENNPLSMLVAASTITGPQGPVEHVVVVPASHPWGATWSTVILFPAEPFAASTSYTVDITMSWNTQPSRDETLTFTTGTEAAGAGLARALD